MTHAFDERVVPPLTTFFNNHHDKLLCTANTKGEPSVSLMGTPRMLADGSIDFEISDVVSVTLDNIRQNKAIVFIAYEAAARARDYVGARIYAEVTDIVTSGDKIERIRAEVRKKHGPEKASELQATVNCKVTRVRPIVDRGQAWDAPPFPEG